LTNACGATRRGGAGRCRATLGTPVPTQCGASEESADALSAADARQRVRARAHRRVHRFE